MNRTIFEVEISNSGPKGYETSAVMGMPATWAEFNDALQKARIADARYCNNELTRIAPEGFPRDVIGQNVNLYELNLLAQRLSTLSEEQYAGFCGLLQMEQEQRAGAIPLAKLINLTFHTDANMRALQVSSDEELGAFLHENEMLPDEISAVLDFAAPDVDFQKKLFAVFGQKHRLDTGGVFTPQGYMEPAGGELEKIYRPGETPYFTRSGAPVVLRVTKGMFNDPDYDNDLVATLDLPAAREDVWKAVEEVDAASPKECSFLCVDCLIPSMVESVNDSIDDGDSISEANRFAEMLHQKKRVWHTADFIKYKALLEASGKPSLGDAMLLMERLDQYELCPDVAEPWEYAQMVFREKYPDLPEALFQTSQAMGIGLKMMEEAGASITDYGLIRRKDGTPLMACQAETPKAGMADLSMA